MAIPVFLPALLPIFEKVAARLFPDPETRARAETDMMRTLLEEHAQIEKAAAQIVQSEAASNHWLAANWRPIMMLVFGALIVARWFGFAAPNLSEAEYLKLWSIVEFGLGGYVVGRSVEKIVPSVARAIQNAK